MKKKKIHMHMHTNISLYIYVCRVTSSFFTLAILSNFKDDVEAEMRRLKHELKQTMDMYSTACKEAVTAKQKVKDKSINFLNF